MDYQFKSYSQGNKKKSLPIYFILVPCGIWIAFMYWSIILGRRVVLFEWFPQWTIGITFAAVVGLIGGVWSILHRPTKLVFKTFSGLGSLALC